MFIDTHTHLYSKRFNNDLEEVIERAIESGTERMYLPNIDSESIEAMLELEKNYPNNCIALMGLHPTSVKENYLEELEIIKKWLDERSFPAIGEIGIDLYWDKTFFNEQEHVFRKQINWAKELHIPIIIHGRDATKEILRILEDEKNDDLHGIWHCFVGSQEEARKIIDLGYYLGIGGVVTFKNGGLDIVLESIPLDKIVLETDSPYLTPDPYRGKRNESSYIPIIAKKIAEIKGVELDLVESVTTNNALNIFGEN